jgi:tRNA/rRNA methyltransferase
MAGTDRSRRSVKVADGGPAFILVRPQLGENIGMAARAMMNCELYDLRLVRPRDGWPNAKAIAAASGAIEVLNRARLFDTAEEAIAGLNRVYASTARPRGMTKTVITPNEAGREMRDTVAGGDAVGILFGPEAGGLENDEIVLADAIVTAPLNPGFSSLNLAQAVFVMSYEWYRQGDITPERQETMPKQTRPATKNELLGLFEHLEGALDDSGFFRVDHKRPVMSRNLRNMFQKAHLTAQEVRTLRGVITSLTDRRIHPGSKQKKEEGD